MTIDTVLKLVQCAFYITAGTVAILTFLKAKNGLLNSVNTEYQKRVMDHLADLSEELYSEFDPESEEYWVKQKSVDEVLERIHEKCRPHKHEIITKKQPPPGIPISTLESKLSRLVEKYKSDPFIPESIRTEVVCFFDKRVSAMRNTYISELDKYKNELAEGKHWDTLDTNRHWMHNRIMDGLRSHGCGIEEIGNDVHQIRRNIQMHLEGFNPIKKR